MRKVLISAVVLLLIAAGLAPPAGAVDKEIIQLQRDVALLQQQVRELQASHDENVAVLKTLLEQAVDAVNRMTTTVEELEKTVKETRTDTASDMETLRTQVQSLRDAVDEVTARLGRMAQGLDETQSVMRSVDARLAGGAPPPGAQGPPARAEGGPGTPSAEATEAAPTPAPPSAKVLYDNALRDFLSGNYDLAREQFQDYLKYYGRSELAGNAQFYLGEVEYRRREFEAAIEEYEKVLENYPASYKVPAAYFKKGYALLELGKQKEGIEQLRTLIEKFPRSDEARHARDRLERLGATPARPGS